MTITVQKEKLKNPDIGIIIFGVLLLLLMVILMYSLMIQMNRYLFHLSQTSGTARSDDVITRTTTIMNNNKPVETPMPTPAPATVVTTENISDEHIAPLFMPSVKYWEDDIIRWGREYDIDPNLIATVMQIESCGNKNVSSSAGAMGLFQVMPFHFSAGENPFNPDTNAKRGLAYLKRSIETFGVDNIKIVLAGYNAGISGASRPYWPYETQRYTYWGNGIYNDAKKGRKESDRLSEWLNSGGASLCTQAEQSLGLK